MSYSSIANYFLNRNFLRYFLSIICRINCYIKTKTLVRVTYNQKYRRWIQFDKDICYYVDQKPNWNLNFNILCCNVNRFNFIKYQPLDSDIIFDIGAGIGTETLVYSKLVPRGKVYAFEAHPDTFSSLEILIANNRINNVVLSNIAISNNSASLFIENRSNHAENRVTGLNSSGIQINATTLDDFIKKHNILKVDFIKMNIEGAELEAIEGMTETIKITHNVAISCHDFLFGLSSMPIRNSVSDFLIKNGFTISYQTNGLNDAHNSWLFGEK